MFGFFNRLFLAVLPLVMLSGMVPLVPGPDAFGAETAGAEGKLRPLWKKYRNADAADRPDKAAQALEDIISVSGRNHAAWDFFNAWKIYRTDALSVDWSRKAEIDSSMMRSARDFGEPVVEYSLRSLSLPYGKGSRLEFARRNRAALESGNHGPFYGLWPSGLSAPYGSPLQEAVRKYIDNDYEYVLWTMLPASGGDGAVAALLAECLGDSYPERDLLEYYMAGCIRDADARKASLESFVSSHRGKAVALFAMQDLLGMRFSSLRDGGKARSEDYVGLEDDCREFERMRNGFAGEEKDLVSGCNAVKGILSALSEKAISVCGEGDTLDVLLRNLDEASVEVRRKGDDSIVFFSELQDRGRSLYAYDTVRVAIPDMEDGFYSVRCFSGETEAYSDYQKISISVACRRTRDGVAVYAADMESGRPLEKADIEVRRRDTLIFALQNVAFDGFVDVPLPESSGKGMASGFRVRCSYTDVSGFMRRSEDVYVEDGYDVGAGNRNVRARIFNDRGVYSPGDTVFFKSILFKAEGAGSSTGMEVLPEGVPVRVYMKDMYMKSVDSLDLSTGIYGSVSGVFIAPSGGMNGRYHICVAADGVEAGSGSFLVETVDFPAFSLELFPLDCIIFPGDTVSVSGKVESFSGHGMDGAVLKWKVLRSSSVFDEGTSCIGRDGLFSFPFVSADDGRGSSYYEIEVSVTDAAGRTEDTYTTLNVTYNVDFDILQVSESQDMVTREDTGYCPGYSMAVMPGDTSVLHFQLRNSSYEEVKGVEVVYSVYHENEMVFAGRTLSGTELPLDFTGMPSGLYRVEAEVSLALKDMADSAIVKTAVYDLIRVQDSDDRMYVDVETLFRVVEDGNISLQAGSGKGPLWGVAEIWGEDPFAPLLSEPFCLEEEYMGAGPLRKLSYRYEESYPDEVRLEVMYFREGHFYSYSADYQRADKSVDLPVDFVVCPGEAGPDEEVTVRLETSPDAECLFAVFDKSTEQIAPNTWSRIFPSSGVADVNIMASAGYVGCDTFLREMFTHSFMKSATAPAAPDNSSGLMDYLEEGCVSGQGAIPVRDRFSRTLAFVPDAVPGPDGSLSLTFRTSGNISTYNVAVFVHDRSLRNSVSRHELTVTRPLAISVAAPQFLYSGDRYGLTAAVSNDSGCDVSGILDMYAYNCENYRDSVPSLVMDRPVSVEDGAVLSEVFESEVPDSVGTAGFLLRFRPFSGENGDAVFVSVPVKPAAQVLKEAYSCVFLPGMDADSVRHSLMERFVNTSPYGAEYREISLRDMIGSALPELAGACGEDVISLSGALYTRVLSGRRKGEPAVDTLSAKMLECRTGEGGFSWFPGMHPSPLVTSVVLERMADAFSRTGVNVLDEDVVSEAVSYLDSTFFRVGEDRRAYGIMDIGLSRYLYVRSMFPSVPVTLPESRKELSDFRKSVRGYMTAPSGAPSVSGRLGDKARRAWTAVFMIQDGASQLREAFGIGNGKVRRLERTVGDDIASLVSYTVRHPSGGRYCPAVSGGPSFGGESMLYVHSLIADLLGRYGSSDDGQSAAETADGIRLWMMVQKEGRQWGSDPGYARAVASVMDASEDILATRVMVLSKSYSIPFSDISASGNGFSISREYLVENPETHGFSALRYGDTLSVGDKVICRYTVRSSDSRSFVRMSVPRPAALYPSDYRSGMTWWWLRPLTGRLSGAVSPAGYRNVLSDRTDYYFDVFPEGETVIEEEAVVRQAGSFVSAVPEIESMYAPHYRANDKFYGKIFAE